MATKASHTILRSLWWWCVWNRLHIFHSYHISNTHFLTHSAWCAFSHSSKAEKIHFQTSALIQICSLYCSRADAGLRPQRPSRCFCVAHTHPHTNISRHTACSRLTCRAGALCVVTIFGDTVILFPEGYAGFTNVSESLIECTHLSNHCLIKCIPVL